MSVLVTPLDSEGLRRARRLVASERSERSRRYRATRGVRQLSMALEVA